MRQTGILRFLTLAVALIFILGGFGPASARPTTGPYSTPDYFETPNWAYSPPIPKFVDELAPLGCGSPNNLGQCIPIAVPDTEKYPGSDYYEIELVQFREQMSSFFSPLNTPGDKVNASSGGTMIRGYRQINPGGAYTPDAVPHYMGPIIIAQKNRPVRIKFINSLPVNENGDLFIPVDTTVMGSGDFEINYDPQTNEPADTVTGWFPQNRALLHLHGGRTPWISDGTPHQWTAPAGETTTTYLRGTSTENVPDMPDPGDGAITYYYTNQQSSRLLFYHDHAWGITRLNIYVGMAAPYLIRDDVEKTLIADGTIPGSVPGEEIPLSIQDKTFVDAETIGGALVTDTTHWGTGSDPTWRWGSNPVTVPPAPGEIATPTPTTGDLWWPHVYMPAQNPFNPDGSGIALFGRWHYGPWFFPATPVCGSVDGAVPPFCINYGPVDNPYADPANPEFSATQPPQMPGTPNVSWGAEAFLDTMMVNGTVYPKLNVDAKKYRFRILNASHDRFLNLQLYKATPIVKSINVLAGGSGYIDPPTVTITPHPLDAGVAKGATATAVVQNGVVTAINLNTVGSGYAHVPTVAVTGIDGSGAAAVAEVYTELTEVGMVPAAPTPGFPANWPRDGREGGVPDPDTRGPAMIQIGTDAGFLPAPVVLPNHPVAWNLDVTLFNVGNVMDQAQGGGTLILGPAQRADVVVDFAGYEGSTLILYNDAPTAFPALDPHYDFYTGAPERSDMGGYPLSIPPGVGPNIRTVMQINVAGTGGAAPVNGYDSAYFTSLENKFAYTGTYPTGTPGVFAASQDPIIVGQTDYDSAYGKNFPASWPNWGVSRISDGAISYERLDGAIETTTMKPKAIHDEMGATFDDYGRMSAKLGLEMPFTNAAIANFILQNFVDPTTEIVNPDEVQIWRITHNGVDSHPIHFHLFDVQVLNRVAWDGFIRLPDPNELGWMDTVRMNPLEDTIVALKPVTPRMPFGVPISERPLNPEFPIGSTEGFSQIDITDGGNLQPLQQNEIVNFDNEYVWHCHILSHEENDMMRTISFHANRSLPFAISDLAAGAGQLTWTDPTPAPGIDTSTPPNLVDNGTIGNPANEVGFRVERAAGLDPFAAVGNALANATSFTDDTAVPGGSYRYQVVAYNGEGETPSNIAFVNTDTVTITQANYNAATGVVGIRATSTASLGSVTLQAAVTAGGATVKTGNMTYNAAGGYYLARFFNIPASPVPDSVTVTSSGGGMNNATIPYPPADTVNVTQAIYDANSGVLGIRATSDAAAGSVSLRAVVRAAGVDIKAGNMTYNAAGGYYLIRFFNVPATPAPDSVMITSSGGGSNTASIPYPPADVVAITQVNYNAGTGVLGIRATSNAAAGSVTLRAVVSAAGVDIKAGNMTYNAAGGYYLARFFNVPAAPAPDNVTVTSSGGGSDTAPVPFP